MTEHPIIISSELIPPTLDGRKTITRRVIKPQPHKNKITKWRKEEDGFRPFIEHYPEPPNYTGNTLVKWADTLYKCPYGQVGDKLWVAETYTIINVDYFDRKVSGFYADDREFKNIILNYKEWIKFQGRKHPYRTTSSRFMYKSLSRITLEITNIGVERLQEITPKDVIAEGFKGDISDGLELLDKFTILWDKLNAKRGYSWGSNPWVFVIEFKK